MTEVCQLCQEALTKNNQSAIATVCKLCEEDVRVNNLTIPDDVDTYPPMISRAGVLAELIMPRCDSNDVKLTQLKQVLLDNDILLVDNIEIHTLLFPELIDARGKQVYNLIETNKINMQRWQRMFNLNQSIRVKLAEPDDSLCSDAYLNNFVRLSHYFTQSQNLSVYPLLPLANGMQQLDFTAYTCPYNVFDTTYGGGIVFYRDITQLKIVKRVNGQVIFQDITLPNNCIPINVEYDGIWVQDRTLNQVLMVNANGESITDTPIRKPSKINKVSKNDKYIAYLDSQNMLYLYNIQENTTVTITDQCATFSLFTDKIVYVKNGLSLDFIYMYNLVNKKVRNFRFNLLLNPARSRIKFSDGLVHFISFNSEYSVYSFKFQQYRKISLKQVKFDSDPFGPSVDDEYNLVTNDKTGKVYILKH